MSRPTLADVAARAGVAISTASRALHRPGRIRAETAARVRAAADELGYVPSAAARQLHRSSAGAVALVVPDLTNPFFMALVRGSTRLLRAHDVVQVVADVEEEPESEEQTLAALAGRVDGMLLAASRLDAATLSTWSRRVPLVAVNHDAGDPEAPTVTIGTQGVEEAVEHLAGLGHRHLAYASGPATSWADARRRTAVVETCARLGVRLTDLGHHPPRRDAGAAAADAVLRSGATAVLTFNDLQAFGVLDRLASRGVRVPEDVSVIGHDDIFGADLTSPALTTVTVPAEELGARAAARLLGAVGLATAAPSAPPAATGPASTGPDRLATHLTVRGSTAPV